MNIIEAWEAAKDGQLIASPSCHSMSFTKRTGALLVHVLAAFSGDETLLAKDWAVVSTKHREVIPFPYGGRMLRWKEERGQKTGDCAIPERATITIEWEE